MVEANVANLTPGTCSCAGLYYGNTTSIPANLSAMHETPRAICRSFTSEKPLYMKKYFPIATIDGTTKKTVNSDITYSSPFSASPSSQGYISLFWQNLNETSSTGHNARVKITFYCRLFSPKVLSSS